MEERKRNYERSRKEKWERNESRWEREMVSVERWRGKETSKKSPEVNAENPISTKPGGEENLLQTPPPTIKNKYSKGPNQTTKMPNQPKEVKGIYVSTIHLVNMVGLGEVYRVGIRTSPNQNFAKKGQSGGGVWRAF